MRRTFPSTIQISIFAAVITSTVALSALGTPRKPVRDDPARKLETTPQKPGVAPPASPARERPPTIKKIEQLIAVKPVAKTADPDLNKLLVARCEAAIDVTKVDLAFWENGTILETQIYADLMKFQNAFLELSQDPKDRIPFLELCVDMTKAIEVREKARYEAAQAGPQHVYAATCNRIDAEINLLKEKKKLKEQ